MFNKDKKKEGTNMQIHSNIVHDAKHLKNLYAHMDRTSRKYDAVRDQVEVFVAKELNEEYNGHMAHVVMEFATFDRAKVAGQYVAYNLGKPCYAVTVVGGAQPDGSYIKPCIHIIYDENYIRVLERILRKIHL